MEYKLGLLGHFYERKVLKVVSGFFDWTSLNFISAHEARMSSTTARTQRQTHLAFNNNFLL